MDIKKVIINEDDYDTEIGITVEEWKEILEDEKFETYWDVLVKFYLEPEHKSTCKALGEKYNTSPQSFNSSVKNFARAVQKKLNRFELFRSGGSPTYWIIPMVGKDLKKGLFEWTLRTELSTAIQELNIPKRLSDGQKDEYLKFKKLLEYFVAHLEWVVNKNESNRGYVDYIKPLIISNEFSSSGQGHKGNNIQSQIDNWESYRSGNVCINIQATNYQSRGSYINWEETGINVIAKWNNNHIDSLAQEEYQFWLKPPPRKNLGIIKSIDSLGLFDNKEEVTGKSQSIFRKL